MIEIALQSGSIPDRFTDLCIESCVELGVDYKTFGIVPFIHELVGVEDFNSQNLYIPFGSVKIIELGLQKRLPNNWKLLYHKENFRLSKILKSSVANDLLNSDASIHILKDIVEYNYEYDVFIKPTDDLKLFDGIVIEKGHSLAEKLSNSNYSFILNSIMNNTVSVAKRKNTGVEFRLFVVGDNVVAASYYKKYGQHYQETLDVETMSAKVKELALRFRPAEAYVVDLMSPELYNFSELKIVEYNAIQCSGHYSADTKMIIKSIYDFCLKDTLDQHKIMV